jgi:hypothetical protein
MGRSYTAERVSQPADYRLPHNMSREVGRIIVRWAYFEFAVQQMNWQALGVSDKAGRIAVREPRVEERLEMLSELISLRQASWDKQLYKSVLDRAKLLASKRHLLGHGVWTKLRGKWHVEATKGQWPKYLADIVKGSRKVTPELIPITIAMLKTTSAEIENLITDLERLRGSAAT